MSKRDDHQNQMKILSHFLGISESPESDFLSIIDKQIDGTCEWLTDKSSFHEWQDGRDDPPRLFWLNGDPATGKSTATGHVVKYLDSCGLDCSYYFFRQSDKGSSNVASLLRSLAFQMALGNPKVRQVLLKMQQDAETLPKDDERMIWRTIFVARIFLIEFNQPHYWVIDALDECRNSSTFFALLSKLDNSFPLRVFVTSRPSPSTERLLLHEKLRVTIERVKVDDTLRDIQLFLKANSNFLPVDDETASGDLIKIITEKSNGCFLWVALVLKELESTHSEQQIWEVLKDVPTEMDELYTRIFDGMTSLPRDRELAKAIFRWTVCTTRPLTTEELKGALQFDIKETFPRIEKSIRSVCGNLVQVDKQSRVKVAHQTVRAFLTKEGLDSEFAIDRVRENSRLAEVCLEYLAGDELKNPRSRRGSAGRRPVNRSTFVEYASHNFSEHVARSSSSIDTHFVQLEAFLNTNVLTWVELIAQGGNLYPLTQTAKNFRVFLERRAKYRSPLGQAVHTVDAWSNDLIHLVAAYGKSLLSSPASIHSLIPPTCPLESMLYKTFGNLQPCLKVVGLSETDWDDRLATITFRQQRVTAIACQNTRFAVGLPDGCIAIFFTSTLQEARKLDHEEPVRHLTFAHLDTLLASGGRRKIRLWNVITGVELWMTDHRNDILTLSFNEDYTLLMAATKANQIAFWNVKNGHERDTCPIHETIEGRQSEYRPPATHAQFSSEQNLLAIGHRQRAISFWDLEANSFIGQFYVSGAERYPEPLLFALVFNPNPDLSLLAACYQEEYLVVLDPWNQEQQAMIKTVVHVLAASPDGKTLAAGDSSGTIKLYDFESLRLLYRVTTPDYNVNAIMFSNNNLRLFDVRSNHCNVWEPAVLVRQLDSGDGQSENISEEIPSTPQDLNANIWDGDLTITAIIDHHKGSALFCGREDGSVVVFEATTGKLTQSLYSHTKNIAICLLCWNRDENILVSCDISGRFLAREVQRTSSGRWIPHEPLLDARSSQAIQQVIISPNGKLLLLSTATSDELWSLTSGLIHSCSMPHSLSYTRITHPGDPNQLLFISSEIARIYNWENLEELTSTNGVALGGFSERNSLSDDAISCFGSSKACVIFCNPRHTDAKPYLQLWPTSSLNPEAKFVKPIEEYSHIAAKIKSVIGIHKSSLLFLDHDGWVCSVRIDGVRTGKYHYVKHFFVPYGWHSGAEPILRCTCKGYIVLARRDEIAIFHKGLEFEEKVEVCEND